MNADTDMPYELVGGVGRPPLEGPWCQRWLPDRTSTFRHAGLDSRFSGAGYSVCQVPEAPAREFVLAHHYSASFPAARMSYGLWRSSQLVGVAVLSVPMSKRVLTNAFPGLEAYSESLELGRFVLTDDVPANGESWFLARVFRQAAADHQIRGVVAHSDPMPRTSADGSVVMPGHVGTIYAASNARYGGRSTARSLIVLPDGTVFSDRAAQKIRSQDQGSGYAEAKLVGFGADPRRGEEPAVWLAAALTKIGADRVRHRGCHRFLFAIGANRKRVVVAPSAGSYPKQRDSIA